MTYVQTIPDLSAAVDRSQQVLYTYKAKGMPWKDENGYPVEPIRAWIEENSGRRNVDGKSGDKKDGSLSRRKLAAEVEEREAKAELAQIRVDTERGKLFPIEEVKARDLARITRVKKGMTELARRLPSELLGLGPREMESIILQRCKELAEKFSNM